MRWALIVTALLVAVSAHAEDISPVDEAQCAAMKAHHVLNAGAPVGCDRLAVVRFSYIDFAGRSHDDGEVVVLDALAPHVKRIFAELYRRRFPIAKAQPMEAFDGDDNASMAANNTSAFNDRTVPGSSRVSLHAYGAAIDLNPVENPFLPDGTASNVAPADGRAFLDRHRLVPGMAETVVDVFAANGLLEWGGDWHEPIDFQHFDIGRPLAERLANLPQREARAAFESVVRAFQRCVAQKADNSTQQTRRICAAKALN